MRYCPECGTKIKNKKTELTYSKKNNYLKAAGVLTTIAASLCFLIAVIGLVEYSSHLYYSSPYTPIYDDYYFYEYAVVFPAQYVIVVAFGFFAFVIGLISGIMIFMKKLFNLVIIGQIGIMGTTLLLLIAEYWFFVLLGVPILVVTAIAFAFTSISKNEFVS